MLLRSLLNGIYFSGIQSVCAPIMSGAGSILMLHHVRNEPDRAFLPNYGLSVSPEFLDVTILRLKQEGYRFVSLDEMEGQLTSGRLTAFSRPMIALTLDDGYRDNLVNAVPVFRRHEVPYTIYVAPGMVDRNHAIWWEDLEAIIANRKRIRVGFPSGETAYDCDTVDEKYTAFRELMTRLTTEVTQEQQREIVTKLSTAYNHDSAGHTDDQIMNWQELKTLSKDSLCSLGGHTIGHFAVARLTRERALEEIQQSCEILEKKTGKAIRHFAYPYGCPAAAGVRDFELARELGLATAVTTRHGVLYPEHAKHLTALPRISMNGSYQSMRYIRTLLSGVTTRLKNRGGRLNVA